MKLIFPGEKVAAAETRSGTVIAQTMPAVQKGTGSKRSHTLASGESLWSIARDRVGPDDAVLLPYWRALCDANRATLASGDVNVIHPGETVVLPG